MTQEKRLRIVINKKLAAQISAYIYKGTPDYYELSWNAIISELFLRLLKLENRNVEEFDRKVKSDIIPNSEVKDETNKS